MLLEGFSLFAKSIGYSALAVLRLLTAVASLLIERGLPSVWASVAAGLSLCHWGQAQWVWGLGVGAPRHVGSSWIRDGTSVPCIIARLNLNYWTTREAQ